MGSQIKTIYKKAETSFNNPEHKKKWQGGIGILVMVVFVLSSVLFNGTVQALNKAAGNGYYGYRTGTYGYNNANASSDFLPKAPTSITTSNVATTSITLSWTAPTQTTESTSLDNFHATTPYLIHYSTSSLSTTACSGGDTATATSATVPLTGLTAGTVYNVNICTKDANDNRSDDIGTTAGVLSSTFTTAAAGGAAAGGSTGGTGGTASIFSTPTVTTTTVTPSAPTPTVGAVVSAVNLGDASKFVVELSKALGKLVARDETAEKSNAKKVAASAIEFTVTLGASTTTVAANFVTYGTSAVTVKLGSGERLALVRDQLETLGKLSVQALEQIANGQKPTERNLKNERAQVKKALSLFQKLTGKKAPDFKNAKHDLAWNTLMYRIRFQPRDLAKERAGIGQFKKLFKKNPKTPLEWSAVRAYGYVLKAK